MLLPKRVKYRRQFRGSMAGKATRGNKITNGEYGIVATEPCWIKSNQIEAARIAMTRYIKRVLEKAANAGSGDSYESITYEGYGPSGIAVIVETMTDSRNRTAGNVRHHFDKYGGKMGAAGCVSWNFSKKGVLVIDNEDGDYEEDNVMMDAMDCGADDFEAEGDCFTIYTDPDDFNAVADALTKKGYTFVSAQIEMVPGEYKKLDNPDDITNMEKMLDIFEDDDDVQNVWHNWDRD